MSLYRQRETIESFFKADKQHADGSRIRVWSPDILRGRMFVQFVSLCYYEYLSERIRQIKASLSNRNNGTTQTKETIDLGQKLLQWMQNTPLYLQLQWFDTIEEVKISSELKNKRWNTEVTKRDKLYLEKLGMVFD